MLTNGCLSLHLIAVRGSVVVGPAQQDREESAWLSRAVDGEEAAYRWLLVRYRERVVRVAAATLGCPAEAEDAAQEAFIKAFRSLRSLESKQSFYGWISKITVRICLDQKRLKRAQEVQLLAEGSPVHQDSSAETVDSVVVWQVLNQLSPPMRAALVLRELDGFDYGEIGQSLGIPVGTVRSRLNSARARFKELWEAACTDAEGNIC